MQQNARLKHKYFIDGATLLSRLRRCPFPQSHITHRTSTVSSTTFTQHSGSYIYPRHPQFQSPNQSTVCKKQQQTRTTMATCSKALLFAILGCSFVCSALAARELIDDSVMAARHEQWMSQYGRFYKDDAEKAQRFEVFKANVKFIESFNAARNRKFAESNSLSRSTSSPTSLMLSSGRPRLTRASNLDQWRFLPDLDTRMLALMRFRLASTGGPKVLLHPSRIKANVVWKITLYNAHVKALFSLRSVPYYISCLVPKKFPTVPVTSNFLTHAWSIKWSWKNN